MDVTSVRYKYLQTIVGNFLLLQTTFPIRVITRDKHSRTLLIQTLRTSGQLISVSKSSHFVTTTETDQCLQACCLRNNSNCTMADPFNESLLMPTKSSSSNTTAETSTWPLKNPMQKYLLTIAADQLSMNQMNGKSLQKTFQSMSLSRNLQH